MFVPKITADGILREIISRVLGEQAAAINDFYNLIRDFPALLHLVDFLLNHIPGQTITGDELSAAMNDLLTFYNRKTDNKYGLTPVEKSNEKMMNYTFVSMVHDAILSNLIRIK